jgi:pyruvate/2-oxoglutarate dehydrogenase complex dihydrolipoamide acyltransferase (E2) component
MRRELKKDEMGRYYYPLDENLWPLVTNFRGERAYSFSVGTEIDMTEADDFRKKIEKESGAHVSINSLIVKATADALEDFPILSGMRMDRLDRIICPDPKEIMILIPIQLGDTICALVIEKANQKGLIDLSKELNEQIKLAKGGSSPKVQYWNKPMFCISNMGTIGCMNSCFGQMSGNITSALAICSILKKPAVKRDKVVIRKMMNVVLCWDHFAMFANTPIEFLSALKKKLENPSHHLV